MKKIVIDVCWTLYRSNTTFDFIRFVKRNASTIERFILVILDTTIVKFILILIGRLTKRDVYRFLYIYQLKGYSYDVLNRYADSFYNECLQYREIAYAHDFLNEKSAEKDVAIFLCSASLDILVSTIAKRLDVQHWYASELKFNNEVCTGKLGCDLLSTKDKLFTERLFWVMTDNKSDLELLHKAENYTILSSRKNLPFWEKQQLDVAHVLED